MTFQRAELPVIRSPELNRPFVKPSPLQRSDGAVETVRREAPASRCPGLGSRLGVGLPSAALSACSPETDRKVLRLWPWECHLFTEPCHLSLGT